jgi:predicted 2-oxoglutarate/Fe(II)-dependent dioxygenase YbiX/peroxiredoxin
MTHLMLGEPAPWFTAPTPSNPTFHFSSIAGRYVLMGFLPADLAARDAVLADLQSRIPLLDDSHVTCFLVVRDADSIARARDRIGLRWFLDADGAVSRLYGALSEDGAERPMWLLADPSLRILTMAPIEQTRAMFDRVERLAPVEAHAGTPLHAPVAIVPRIFEPELCRRLIDLYETDGGQPSGVMRQQDGKTVGVLDNFKKRRDANITDPALQDELRQRIIRRLLPEIAKIYQFRATRIERYIVACYDADEGGYFRPHRDNTTSGTAHRRFAVSINLNAEEFEGGDLRFPEFGPRTYRPPTGGAVVFSCSLLHEATPVTKGRRYAFLPFLFDEAGARIRAENLHYLQVPEPVTES